MKLFKTFFTAIAATLILSGIATASPSDKDPIPEPTIETSIGRAQFENTKAGETAKPEVIINGRTVVTSDFGGGVMEYIEKYNRWRLEGRKVRVEDDCMSACTFLIGRLPEANVCVSDIAQFAFHSAWVMTFAGPMYAQEATRLMWQYYPEKVKVKLRELGWDGGEHPDFVYIKGTDLFPLCEGN